MRDQKGVHVVIVRFDRTDSSSKNRTEDARFWITKLDDVFQEMGE
jgi:hypothetical protein